jgi:hypothetical protein
VKETNGSSKKNPKQETQPAKEKALEEAKSKKEWNAPAEKTGPEPKKKDPPCARCHKPKEVRKHHFPAGSKRLAFLCEHCYGVVRRQRKKSRKWGFL